MRKLLPYLIAASAVLASLGTMNAAQASEGAASDYFPGAFGSFLVAVPPEPGFSFGSQTLFFGGQAQKAIVNGRQTFGLNAFAVYEYLAPSYTFEQPVLGGRLQTGVAVPVVGHASMGASLQTRLFGTFSGGDSDTGFGDMLLNPFALYWNFGDFNVKLTEYIVAPTGRYDVNSLVNVGRNYWAFDTQLGLTWFHKQTGTEISLLPGIMVNTTNPATDYHTGTEFHLDFMVNQFVAPTFAVGLQGYWYKQVDGDSGSGAVFGPFMGEAVGIGPALLWSPEFLKGKAAVILKYLRDVSNTNRLQGDWGQITFSYRF